MHQWKVFDFHAFLCHSLYPLEKCHKFSFTMKGISLAQLLVFNLVSYIQNVICDHVTAFTIPGHLSKMFCFYPTYSLQSSVNVIPSGRFFWYSRYLSDAKASAALRVTFSTSSIMHFVHIRLSAPVWIGILVIPNDKL